MHVTTVIFMTKHEFRIESLKIRKMFHPIEQKNLTNDILDKLQSHPLFIKSTHVGLYYPIQNEPNLLELISLYPEKVFYLPNVENNTLVYRMIDSLDKLEDAPFGTKQVSKANQSIDDCELYLIPCVGTSGLLRIGYGKGYFDAYLKDKIGYKLGITYPMFKTKGINKEAHDILLDEVL